jgi:hypothetical protein
MALIPSLLIINLNLQLIIIIRWNLFDSFLVFLFYSIVSCYRECKFSAETIKSCSPMRSVTIHRRCFSTVWRTKTPIALHLVENSVLTFYMVLDTTQATLISKSPVVWDIRPCSPLKANRLFGGTCRLNLQGRRISKVRNKHEARRKQTVVQLWRWRRNVPPKSRLTFYGLHDVIS